MGKTLELGFVYIDECFVVNEFEVIVYDYE